MTTTLKLVPSLPARQLPDGRVGLTQKFLDGVNEFHKFWANPLTVYMSSSTNDGGNLDDVSVLPKSLNFGLEVMDSSQIAAAITSDPSAVVMLSLDDFRQNELWRSCREHNVACFYVSEYSLATRQQIITATTPNPIRRMRKRFWEKGQEAKRMAAVKGSSGLQCNGTPTYESYHALNSHTLLFFDSRITEDLLGSEEEIRHRLSDLRSRPIQLLFSGRLDRMKGATQLLDVARELRSLNMNFHLSICGDGELKGKMSQDIQASNLSEHVSMEGTLDFKTGLVPFVRSKIDMFVCCHPQGDPSCTYLETMSCGVPIAGYGNEAFAGVVQKSNSGWQTPMNDPAALAKQIANVAQTPDSVREMSLSALNFAKKHTFEQTFLRRTEHLKGSIPRSRSATAVA